MKHENADLTKTLAKLKDRQTTAQIKPIKGRNMSYTARASLATQGKTIEQIDKFSDSQTNNNTVDLQLQLSNI